MPLLFDATGLQIQPQSEIVAELAAAIKSGDVLGPSARPEDPSTYLGQLVNVFAERDARVQQVLGLIIAGLSIDTASGYFLDTIVGLRGVKRQGATQSRADGTIITTGAALIPAGSRVRDTTTLESWTTLEDVNAPGAGTFPVQVQAEELGPISYDPVSAWQIITPVLNWQSFEINVSIDPEDLGRDQESDESLRERARLAAVASGNDVEAITGAVAQVNGVTYVGTYENRDCANTVDGVPPGALEVVVEGGSPEAIRQAIYEHLPPGTQAFGSDSGFVDLPDGSQLEIGFTRPADVEIFLQIAATVNPETYNPDQLLADTPTINDAVIAAADTDTAPGVDVIPQSYAQIVWAATDRPLNRRPALATLTVEASVDGVTFQDTPIVLGHRERPDFDRSRITLNGVN